MFSRSKLNKKGFLLSLEALLCLIILVTSIGGFVEGAEPSVDEEIAYTQAQDMVEVCLILNKGRECFKDIEKINENLEEDEDGEIVFKRRIEGKTKKIKFSFSK